MRIILKADKIGIFDSGFGGLTVMHAIKEILPSESILYFADTKNLPYGSKTQEEILKFSLESIHFLNSLGIKLLVLACHSSSVVSLPTLQKYFKFPIVSISSAAIQELLSQKKPNHIAILATEATINSKVYQKTIQDNFPSCKITALACPRFVPLIEMGHTHTPLITQVVVKESLQPLIDSPTPVESILLACTHYPLLAEAIQKEFSLGTQIMDPSKKCALDIKKILTESNLKNESTEPPETKFFVSSNPERFQKIGSLLSSLTIAPILKPEMTSFLY
jgi:glutamate racemase